jgi:ABC-type dipeptide/oligopeptide/nickel transport system permease subunit
MRTELNTLLNENKHTLWFFVWIVGMILLWLWDGSFLNTPARELILTASLNTLFCGILVVFFSLLFGWLTAVGLYFLRNARQQTTNIILTFFLNIIRSIPQIVGILAGYIILTTFIQREILLSTTALLFWMAFVISVFVFLEVSDLIRERIEHFNKRDFVPALLCCGVKESRIINIEILWKNSRAHLLHKLVAIFGISIFLQCSIDFIISVGLTTDVSSTNFPSTLGSVLAKMDSKQDILAVSTVLVNPSYLPNLLTNHLQGISVAFIIVFTLLCMYQISNGLVKRYEL